MHHIQFGYLQIAPVQIAGMAAGVPSTVTFFLKAASLSVITAGNDCSSVFACQGNGAVVGVIGYIPDSLGCLDPSLVAVCIVSGRERVAVSAHLRVLVEPVSFVREFLCQFPGGLAIADVVVLVREAPILTDPVFYQFTAAVVKKVPRCCGRTPSRESCLCTGRISSS